MDRKKAFYGCILVGFLHSKFSSKNRPKYTTSAANLLVTFLDTKGIKDKYPTCVATQ